MIKQPKIVVKFTNPQTKDGTVFYKIQIFDTKQQSNSQFYSWSMLARYSQLRDLHQKCASIYKKEQLPDFPHRKLFGNTNPDFIQKRKKELQNYYNTLLKSIDLKELPQLNTFFYSKRPQKQQKGKISNSNNNQNKNNNLNQSVNSGVSKQNPSEKLKQQTLPTKQNYNIKKIFESITAQTIERMVDISNEFYQQVIDDPRHKLPDGVQRAKYNPKSVILDQTVNFNQIKFWKNNQFDFWSNFFIESSDSQKMIKQFQKIQVSVKQIMKKDSLFCNSNNQGQSKQFNFVMIL